MNHPQTTWRAQAACQGMDTNTFFPGEQAYDKDAALATCHSCPVLFRCLDAALTDPTEAIQGGLTARQRRELRKVRGLKLINYAWDRRSTCGTPGGAMQHTRRGEPSCDACRKAHALYQAERRERASA